MWILNVFRDGCSFVRWSFNLQIFWSFYRSELIKKSFLMTRLLFRGGFQGEAREIEIRRPPNFNSFPNNLIIIKSSQRRRPKIEFQDKSLCKSIWQTKSLGLHLIILTTKKSVLLIHSISKVLNFIFTFQKLSMIYVYLNDLEWIW